MEASHRSIHPNIAGVPWWAALLIAVTATAVGYGIDAGHKELTHVFAGFYIAGCLVAVLAVRQDGIFTAIIQPPLILFCAVPGAYWLFHGGKAGHLKDLLINCGYPLIERFPLMLGTAGIVLLIGLVRLYFGMSHPTPTSANTSDDTATATSGDAKSFVSGIVAKLQSILRPDSDEDNADGRPSAGARRSRASSSAAKARRAARSNRSATRSTRTHSRHSRQSLEDAHDPAERPRRPRRRDPSAVRDYDTGEPPRRSRRRPRPETDPDLRGQPPRETRREPRTRRSPYERPAPRSSRFDGFDRYGDRYDPPGAPEHFGRYDTRDRYERYEPLAEPRPRRAAPNGANPTHHPISQVRYRGSGSPDGPRAEPPSERRRRSRSQGRPPTDSWEYDV